MVDLPAYFAVAEFHRRRPAEAVVLLDLFDRQFAERIVPDDASTRKNSCIGCAM